MGSPKRRNGILNNEIYRGTIVYNRQRFLKDPSTGKRVSRENPQNEWHRQEVPELRIVDEELWEGGSSSPQRNEVDRIFINSAVRSVFFRAFLRCAKCGGQL